MNGEARSRWSETGLRVDGVHTVAPPPSGAVRVRVGAARRLPRLSPSADRAVPDAALLGWDAPAALPRDVDGTRVAPDGQRGERAYFARVGVDGHDSRHLKPWLGERALAVRGSAMPNGIAVPGPPRPEARAPAPVR